MRRLISLGPVGSFQSPKALLKKSFGSHLKTLASQDVLTPLLFFPLQLASFPQFTPYHYLNLKVFKKIWTCKRIIQRIFLNNQFLFLFFT